MREFFWWMTELSSVLIVVDFTKHTEYGRRVTFTEFFKMEEKKKRKYKRKGGRRER